LALHHPPTPPRIQRGTRGRETARADEPCSVRLRAGEWRHACSRPSASLSLTAPADTGDVKLSTTTDLAAFALAFPHAAGRTDRLAAILRFWVPAENARQRERRDRVW
jgi:phage terminase large subunit-like protein